MKAYKFMANYKKRPDDTLIEFEKYLYLEPEDVALANNNVRKFLVQMIGKGWLPDGIYDEIRLYDWKTKERQPSGVKKKKKWIFFPPKKK